MTGELGGGNLTCSPLQVSSAMPWLRSLAGPAGCSKLSGWHSARMMLHRCGFPRGNLHSLFLLPCICRHPLQITQLPFLFLCSQMLQLWQEIRERVNTADKRHRKQKQPLCLTEEVKFFKRKKTKPAVCDAL